MIEIHGIPQFKNENIVELVGKADVALGFPINESTFDACHHLRPRIGAISPSGIILKMV